MRNFPVIIQDSAKRDVANIRLYLEIQIGSRSIARNIAKRIVKRALRIGLIPFGGRPRDDLSLGLRTVPFEDKAVIAYRVEKNRVLIVRVFYAGRDWEAVLLTKMPGTSAPPKVYPPDRD